MIGFLTSSGMSTFPATRGAAATGARTVDGLDAVSGLARSVVVVFDVTVVVVAPRGTVGATTGTVVVVSFGFAASMAVASAGTDAGPRRADVRVDRLATVRSICASSTDPPLASAP